MKKVIGLKYKKKKINLEVKKLSKLEMCWGLMFSRRKKAKALLFEWKNCRIHSFFVFYDFLALWLDENNKIVDKKIVKPFSLCVSSRKTSVKLVEIPINKKYKKDILSLVEKKKHLKRLSTII